MVKALLLTMIFTAAAIFAAAVFSVLLNRAHAQEQTRTCTIVTNSTIENYQHELAHCNGWDHPPFQRGYDPPAEYIHNYDGQLTIYLTGTDYMDQMTVMTFAQMSAKIILAWNRTPPELCGMFWKQHGIPATQTEVDHVIGCAIR